MRSLLNLRADGDCDVAVHPHLNVLPAKPLLLQFTGSTRAKVLLLIDDEPHRADTHEVRIQEPIERSDVSLRLRRGPLAAELQDLILRHICLRHLFSPESGISSISPNKAPLVAPRGSPVAESSRTGLEDHVPDR